MKNYKIDSRQIGPGDVFICLPGGEKYAEDAIQNGATDVLHMNRMQLAQFLRQEFGNPSRRLKVVGVTGTNGKTTTTYLVAQALKKLGFSPYLLGTINSELTTPECLEILARMQSHLAQGGTHFVMEVSSHAIDQGRAWGIEFDVKLLTNITQDHLDYHHTFEAYAETKKSFLRDKDPIALPDAKPCISIYPEDYQRVELNFKNPLAGHFNHENMQSAVAILRALGYDYGAIDHALSSSTPPPGRFELIEEGQDFAVILDFAHTPDGLDNILREAKLLAERTQGRLIAVFGCGGDRDRGKRPKMAKVAFDHADHVVLTQDNPRTESQEEIMKDILEGVPQNVAESGKTFHVEHDREKAIEEAIAYAKQGDVVVLAGKGHEESQIIGMVKHPFSDRDVAKKALKKLSAQ